MKIYWARTRHRRPSQVKKHRTNARVIELDATECCKFDSFNFSRCQFGASAILVILMAFVIAFFFSTFCFGSIRVGRAHALHTLWMRAKFHPRGNKNRDKKTRSNALRMDWRQWASGSEEMKEKIYKKEEEINGHSVMCPLGRVSNIITLSSCFEMFNLILRRCRQQAVDDRRATGQLVVLHIITTVAADYKSNTLHMVP